MHSANWRLRPEPGSRPRNLERRHLANSGAAAVTAGPTVGAAGTSGPVDGQLGGFGRRDAAQRHFRESQRPPTAGADGHEEELPPYEKTTYTFYMPTETGGLGYGWKGDADKRRAT